jgi:hypothetical protein
MNSLCISSIDNLGEGTVVSPNVIDTPPGQVSDRAKPDPRTDDSPANNIFDLARAISSRGGARRRLRSSAGII